MHYSVFGVIYNEKIYIFINDCRNAFLFYRLYGFGASG